MRSRPPRIVDPVPTWCRCVRPSRCTASARRSVTTEFSGGPLRADQAGISAWPDQQPARQHPGDEPLDRPDRLGLGRVRQAGESLDRPRALDVTCRRNRRQDHVHRSEATGQSGGAERCTERDTLSLRGAEVVRGVGGVGRAGKVEFRRMPVVDVGLDEACGSLRRDRPARRTRRTTCRQWAATPDESDGGRCPIESTAAAATGFRPDTIISKDSSRCCVSSNRVGPGRTTRARACGLGFDRHVGESGSFDQLLPPTRRTSGFQSTAINHRRGHRR